MLASLGSVGTGADCGWAVGAGGAVCRRGVRRGAVSRPFRAADLLRALSGADAAPHATVYVDVDSAGHLVVGGSRGAGGAGGAVLCARAALAPNVSARNALLTAAGAPASPAAAPGALLQLRVSTSLAPHAALRVWVDEPLRAALGVPHLAPHNIRGGQEYACDRCAARFPEPNPLKAHLFLGCAAPAPRLFWRELAARLSPAPPPPAAADPARLEALAAAWGGGAHACVYCGKLYSRRYGLKIHIRTHTGYRPLRCRHCARAFGDPSNLNKHLRLHEAPRGPPARDLQRHLRAHDAGAGPDPSRPEP